MSLHQGVKHILQSRRHIGRASVKDRHSKPFFIIFLFTSLGRESSCVPIIKLLLPSVDLMAERQRAYIVCFVQKKV